MVSITAVKEFNYVLIFILSLYKQIVISQVCNINIVFFY